MIIRRAFPFALASCLSSVAAGGPPTYSTVELQARSNIVDGYNLPAASSFNSKTPALNDAGTIAFTLIVVGGGNAGLFTGAGGLGEVVYQAPGGQGLEDPSINSAGLVAFERADLFSDGIFVYDPVTGETTQVIAPDFFNTAGRATIDDQGAIGFRAGDFGGQSWEVFDRGRSTTFAEETGGIAFLFLPAFNNQGRIGGKVRLGNTNNDSPDQLRVYGAAGVFSTVVVDDDGDPDSPYTGFDNSIDLTDGGGVAFIANLVGGGRGVFLAGPGGTTEIATTADPMVSEISFFGPSANADGLVAFRGRDGAGLHAVFVGDGTELRRVIAEHDLVETDLGTGRIDQHDGSITFGGAVSINGRGDVAFNGTLTPADNDQVEWGSGMFIAYANTEPSGDIDKDGDVDVDDLVQIILNWGVCPGCPADLDGNGVVDVNDLLVVILDWG